MSSKTPRPPRKSRKSNATNSPTYEQRLVRRLLTLNRKDINVAIPVLKSRWRNTISRRTEDRCTGTHGAVPLRVPNKNVPRVPWFLFRRNNQLEYTIAAALQGMYETPFATDVEIQTPWLPSRLCFHGGRANVGCWADHDNKTVDSIMVLEPGVSTRVNLGFVRGTSLRIDVRWDLNTPNGIQTKKERFAFLPSFFRSKMLQNTMSRIGTEFLKAVQTTVTIPWTQQGTRTIPNKEYRSVTIPAKYPAKDSGRKGVKHVTHRVKVAAIEEAIPESRHWNWNAWNRMSVTEKRKVLTPALTQRIFNTNLVINRRR